MVEKTRWGNISTSVSKETGVVTQIVSKKGKFSGDKFNSAKEGDAILAKRQELDLLASRAFNFLSKLSLAVTLLKEANSLKDKRKFDFGAAIVGGFVGAVSHLASDRFLDKADLSAFRREEVEIAL